VILDSIEIDFQFCFSTAEERAFTT